MITESAPVGGCSLFVIGFRNVVAVALIKRALFVYHV